ncbi:MAG: ABC transporter ATP-binding protein [Clostridia bacterium]|nr:ABC transporter ATP-binding protein [Clostridia bacterium]
MSETKKKNRLASLFSVGDHEGNADVHYQGNALKRLAAYLKPHRKTLIICFLLVLAVTVMDLYRPILIGRAIDDWIVGTEGQAWEAGQEVGTRLRGVLTAGFWYLLMLVGLFVCTRAQALLMQKMGQDIVYDIRNSLFAHVQSLTMRFFDTTPVGKLVTRLTNDVEALNEVFSNMTVRLFQNVIKIVGLAAVMLALNPRMALWCFLLLPVVGVLTFVFRALSRRAYQLTRTRLTALNTYLSEHISGMRVIQLFGREKRKFEEFADKNGELYNAGFRELMVYALFRPGLYFLSVAAKVIVLVVASRSVLSNVLTLGVMYIFLDYITHFFEPVQELAEQFSTLQSAIASAEKIFTLMDEEPLIRDEQEPRRLPAVKGRIEFDHVWFAYTGEDWVLKDVSFTIEPGQKVAFVGATGAGKSSILNLIGRYYEIQKGQIRIDGVDIRELSREQIRSAIGQVQQDVFIFTGDIASNIRLRNEEITDGQIAEAAREVNAARFIDKLPAGYAQAVTERGSTLSAGQRQLLSFARTLAHNPTILILDEATANIDTETEQWIQEAVETLMRGRTTIMVAHRLSTIQHADRIIVMHHGRIRESGTHQELLQQDGIYKKLYQLQLAE